MKLKRFLTFDEAACELGTDAKGLKQALEIDLSQALPAYIYCGDLPLLARLAGYSVSPDSAPSDSHGEAGFYLLTSRSGPPVGCSFLYSSVEGLVDAWQMGDSEADVEWSDMPQRITGDPVCFELRGFFRVDAGAVKEAARNRTIGAARVAPGSWWADDSKMPRSKDGNPLHGFNIFACHHGSFREIPELYDLLFRASDIEEIRLKAKLGGIDAEPNPRSGWPWGAYETNLLGHLAAAAHEWWSNFDPARADQAPKKNAVVDWLADRGVSRRTATYIDTILRADGLPKGPRSRQVGRTKKRP